MLILALAAWGFTPLISLSARAQEELWWFIEASRDQISYVDDQMREFGTSVRAELFKGIKDARWHIEIALNRIEDELSEGVQTPALEVGVLRTIDEALSDVDGIDFAAAEEAKGYVEEALDHLRTLVDDAESEGLIQSESAAQLIEITDRIRDGMEETNALLAGVQALIGEIRGSLSDAKGEIEAAIAAGNAREIKDHVRAAKWKLLEAYRGLKRVLGAEEVILGSIKGERMALSELTGPLLANLSTLRLGEDPLLDIREEIVYEFEDIKSDLREFQGEVQGALGHTLWGAKWAAQGGLADIDGDGDLEPQCPRGDLNGDGETETCMKEALDIADDLDLGGIEYVKADMEKIIAELIALINEAEDDGLISTAQADPLRERLEILLAYLVKGGEKLTTVELLVDEAMGYLDDAVLTFIHCTYDETGGSCGDDRDGSEDRRVRTIKKGLGEAERSLRKAIKAELRILEDLKYMHANLALFLIQFLREFPTSPGRMPTGSEMELVPEQLALEKLTIAPNPVDKVVRFTAVGQGIASIKVEIFDLAGKQVYASGFAAGGTLKWHLVTSQGELLANGVYLYIITVRSPDGRVLRSRVGKLAVLRRTGPPVPSRRDDLPLRG